MVDIGETSLVFIVKHRLTSNAGHDLSLPSVEIRVMYHFTRPILLNNSLKVENVKKMTLELERWLGG